MDASSDRSLSHDSGVSLCLNCDAELRGPYCAVCGQRSDNPRRLVIGLVQDVIVDTISIDSKLVRTLGMLFWRPGRLARNYIDGKRARYTAPFRLYLFSSLIFFLLAWWATPFADIESGIVGSNAGAAEIAGVDGDGNGDEALDENVTLSADEGPPDIDCEIDTDGTPSSFGQRICPAVQSLVNQLYNAQQRVREDPRLFLTQVRSNIPRVMLLAPVIYAGMLALLYIYRRKILIYDHLIVSLYMHAAFYTFLSAYLILDLLPLVGWLAAPLIVWASLQPFVVFRQAYGSNWYSVVIKYALSNFLYLVSVMLLLVFGVGFALYRS